MQVILTQDMRKLGSIGDTITVKDGFGRNFLIPRSFAVMATRSNLREIEHHKAILAKKKEKLLNEYRSVAKKLEALTITLTKQVGEENKIFGSVTTSEIEEFLAKKGFEVSRKDIKLDDSIKKIGDYTAIIHLHAEVSAKLKLKIEAVAVEVSPA